MKPAEAPAGVPAGAPAPHGAKRLLWDVPLGWQLSALYTVLLAATLILVGTLVYAQQNSFLVQDAAVRLERAASRLVARPGDLGRPTGAPGGGPAERGFPAGDGHMLEGRFGNDSRRTMETLVRSLSGPDVTVAILDSAGNVLTTTENLADESPLLVEPVSAEQMAAAHASNQAVHWVVRHPDGGRQVVVLMRIADLRGPGAAGTAVPLLLEQSASLAAADAALAQLGTYLLLGVLGGMLAGLVVGRAFTQALLRPLDRVAATAEAIAGGDMQRRLLLPAGHNEVARLGQAFDHMVGRLVATLEAQRRFVADASHELRTPLTSLKGLAEILAIGAHGNDSHVVEQSAGAIRGEIDRLSRLVNDLLTLSRLDSTRDATNLPARRTRMDAAATLTAAVTQMGALAEARGVQLSAECTEPLPVIGDSGQIKQILLNLLDNALRYTPSGGAVSVRGALDGSMVRLEVQDTGTGIIAADLPHIFDRFYRGDVSRTRATGNSGLGLAIVRAIVEAHGGTIGVTSTPGAGTCFTIRLPRARVPEAA
ncbi:MAG TPA: HAMP domain-containing sensor histidine kinase [Chloroflexia bacterium]|nr:HAMP domain-containing sensor histidine kinase [Chloroflexia bacterium]